MVKRKRRVIDKRVGRCYRGYLRLAADDVDLAVLVAYGENGDGLEGGQSRFGGALRKVSGRWRSWTLTTKG